MPHLPETWLAKFYSKKLNAAGSFCARLHARRKASAYPLNEDMVGVG